MILSVKVFPNSKKNEVKETGENSLAARLNAPPEKGKANAKLIEALAEHFGVPKSSVKILRGHKTRNKTVEIEA